MPCSCTLRRTDARGESFATKPDDAGRFSVVARAAGVLVYPSRGTTERVDAESLADGVETLAGVPVERGHGGEVIGRVESARVEGDRIYCDLLITDNQAREDIRAGLLNEASADYDIGRLDADGTQRGPFRYRALALIPPGVSRCGPTCSIDRPESRVDCLCSGSVAAKGSSNVKIKIAGKEYEAGSVEAAEAMALEAHRMDSASADLLALRGERSRRIRSDAKRAGVVSRKDADDTTVMQDVIAKVFPSVDLSSASPDFIAGAFACAIAELLDEDPAESDSPAAPPGAAPPKPPADAPATGAAGARMDAFEGRKPRQDAEESALPLDVIARNKMVRAGARLANKED